MREILFRGKPLKNLHGKFMYGSLGVIDTVLCAIYHCFEFETDEMQLVDIGTVGQYTGLTDKNGKKIFEGDIVQYSTYDDFDCQSIVKFGEYKQDGSDGEYKASDCLGFYVEVDNFTCPDWCDDEPERFHDYLKQQSLAEIANQCEIIGNIHDNPELLKVENV